MSLDVGAPRGLYSLIYSSMAASLAGRVPVRRIATRVPLSRSPLESGTDIGQMYQRSHRNLEAVRRKVARPLTLAEKLLFAHLRSPEAQASACVRREDHSRRRRMSPARVRT